MIKRTLYHFHFCCGLGGGAKGFNRAKPVVGNMQAHWECLGGIDVDPAGLRDFERLAGVPGTLLDLFTRDQYIRFHGKEPPAGWREATPEDIRRAARGRRPDAVFISSPCKGASGALSIADPRALHRTKGDAYLTGGHYGVVGFDQSAGAVSASARYDNGRWSVADPRMPAADERLTCIIQSLDGTWHRPFTTLELAALQSLVDPEEQLELDGLSDSDWRERIGNAVPPAAAEAIAHVMGTTLLLAELGETFMLSSMPIWVRPVAVGLSVASQDSTL